MKILLSLLMSTLMLTACGGGSKDKGGDDKGGKNVKGEKNIKVYELCKSDISYPDGKVTEKQKAHIINAMVDYCAEIMAPCTENDVKIIAESDPNKKPNEEYKKELTNDCYLAREKIISAAWDEKLKAVEAEAGKLTE